MAKIERVDKEEALLKDIALLINESKSYVAYTVNATLTYFYWKIGKRMNDEVLYNKRAEYEKQMVVSLSLRLGIEYGSSFSDKNIRKLMQFAIAFPDEQIVASAMRQLSWKHFTLLLPSKQLMQGVSYAPFLLPRN